MLARTWLAWTVGTFAWLVCHRASANGRYPLAGQLVVDPGDPAHLVVRATFGLLDSADSGQSFRWVCENTVGYVGLEDPPIAVMSGGATVVASSRGISVGRERGCSWQKFPEVAQGEYGIDVTALPQGGALALVSSYQDGQYTVRLRKTDDGVAFQDVGPPLPRDFLASTLDVPRAKPDRVYVSGKFATSGHAAVLRSDDAGATWDTAEIASEGPLSIFIGALDPANADVLYLRTKTGNGGDVLVSRDAGKTFTAVWTSPDEVLGFALSEDGTTLAVGGPSSGVYLVNTIDFAFKKTSNVGPYCLTWWGDALLLCAKEALAGFSLGRSVDRGQHFEPLLHLRDVAPQTCAEGASSGVCADYWGVTSMVLGVDGGAETQDAGDAGPDGGSAPVLPSESNGGGCSCRAAGGKWGASTSSSTHRGAILGAVASLCVFAVRARRRAQG